MKGTEETNMIDENNEIYMSIYYINKFVQTIIFHDIHSLIFQLI